MEQQTHIQPQALMGFFGDYAFADPWIVATDEHGRHVQVAEDELIPSDVPVDETKHIRVQYYGQDYWILQSLHFPM